MDRSGLIDWDKKLFGPVLEQIAQHSHRQSLFNSHNRTTNMYTTNAKVRASFIYSYAYFMKFIRAAVHVTYACSVSARCSCVYTHNLSVTECFWAFLLDRDNGVDAVCRRLSALVAWQSVFNLLSSLCERH